MSIPPKENYLEHHALCKRGKCIKSLLRNQLHHIRNFHKISRKSPSFSIQYCHLLMRMRMPIGKRPRRRKDLGSRLFPLALAYRFWHSAVTSSLSVALVFLHNVQIFRLLLKISVEENNWLSLWTNFFIVLPFGGAILRNFLAPSLFRFLFRGTPVRTFGLLLSPSCL